jgi:hypothetical protein
MIYDLMKLGRLRYVGDRGTKIVHDRWHPDCQGCGLDETVRRGGAVGFKPDSLDGAFLEGYDYCEACFDKTDPRPPKWASVAGPMGSGSRDGGVSPPAGPGTSDRGREGSAPSAPEEMRVRERVKG